MGSFYPTAGLGVGVPVFEQPLFGARFHAPVVAMLASDFADQISNLACIQGTDTADGSMWL